MRIVPRIAFAGMNGLACPACGWESAAPASEPPADGYNLAFLDGSAYWGSFGQIRVQRLDADEASVFLADDSLGLPLSAGGTDLYWLEESQEAGGWDLWTASPHTTETSGNVVTSVASTRTFMSAVAMRHVLGSAAWRATIMAAASSA
ncbi:MAG TPA: hypothetical protein VHB21_08625 [Minicystis sp.]|nr:hypothetical protein [Minicystis sp.]